MFSLIITLLIDTTIIKIYDITYKQFISIEGKITLFAANSLVCLIIQYLIVHYIRNAFESYKLGRKLGVPLLYRMSLISLTILAASFALLIFQMFYHNYYNSWIIIFIIFLSYGTASIFVVVLCTLFMFWYKSNHDLIVLLYFLSMSIIVINFIVTATYISLSINDRPKELREYIGGSIDVSVGRHVFLYNLYSVSSIASFVSVWITTVVLMKNYRNKLIKAVVYWLVLSLPLIYFLVSYFYQFIFNDLLIDYLTVDPITVSVMLTAFLSLSKPVGGLTFAIVFWKISRTLSYERKIQTYMIISGWGILLVFATNQATSQSLAPYPPFGLVTNTVLILATYLILLGIYNSAKLVSVNIDLRRSIYKHALESKLLDLIGRAEMDKELQNTVAKIQEDAIKVDTETKLDLDEEELKKHLDFVIKEARKVKED